MEDVQVTGIQQKTLGGKQSFACNFERRRCTRIGRIGGAGIFLECYKDFILNDTARRCCAESLISGTLTAIFGARGTPEAVAIKLNSLTGLFCRFVSLPMAVPVRALYL